VLILCKMYSFRQGRDFEIYQLLFFVFNIIKFYSNVEYYSYSTKLIIKKLKMYVIVTSKELTNDVLILQDKIYLRFYLCEIEHSLF
jgi:hypothetical protein